jgi:inward rectifier potassium channel
MRRRPRHIRVRSGQVELVKLNAKEFDWRDTYHFYPDPELAWVRRFCFRHLPSDQSWVCYVIQPGPALRGRDVLVFGCFFLSVETLATVGYGHMYPESLYGHLLTMLEIMVGLFGLAVITGLIFVRFSRPTARMHFSKVAVIAPFDGVPTLMIRLANRIGIASIIEWRSSAGIGFDPLQEGRW